jgi:hypothetical protein
MTTSRRTARFLTLLALILALPLVGGNLPSPSAPSAYATNLLQYSRQNPLTFYGGYRTVEGIYAFLDEIAAKYPNLVEKIDIGDSWCKTHPGACTQPGPSSGYDLYVLHITTRSIPGPKPPFWFDAGIHSREIATPEIAMRFISLLLEGYESDPDLHWLVDDHSIWVMPLMNPDGYRIVASVGEGGEPFLHRKNADNDDGCDLYPPTAASHFGTDLNRNFPFKWGCCEGSSPLACSQNYRGPNPASAEEIQAVMAMMRQVFADQRGPADTDFAPLLATGIHQNLHSYATLNLYPWGWSATPAPNAAELSNIAAHASALDAGGNGYRYCQAPQCLYVAEGTANDWAYGELGIASLTTELRGNSFVPLYAETEGLWAENRGMLLYLARIARAPYLLTRGPDTTLADRQLTAQRGGIAQVAAIVNYAWTGNNYAQNVAAAELYVDTPPWAGGAPIPMLPTDGALDSPTESLVANIDTTGLPTGRHILYVRGRGVESYEGQESWGPVSAAWLIVEDVLITTGETEGTTASRPHGGRPTR